MKKLFNLLLCFTLVTIMSFPVNAQEPGQTIRTEENLLENGYTIIEEIIVYPGTRSTDYTATKKSTITKSGITIAVIAFNATFRYDGSSVSVVSKSVSQKDTYDGWSYSQTSFTSSGGTVTLKFKLNKWLILSNSYTMTLTCDKNGNLS